VFVGNHDKIAINGNPADIGSENLHFSAYLGHKISTIFPSPLHFHFRSITAGTSNFGNELKLKPNNTSACLACLAIPWLSPLSSLTSTCDTSLLPAVPLFTNHANTNINSYRAHCPEVGFN
jgi:hypothetical protein